jgi:hypothetical protein
MLSVGVMAKLRSKSFVRTNGTSLGRATSLDRGSVGPLGPEAPVL